MAFGEVVLDGGQACEALGLVFHMPWRLQNEAFFVKNNLL